MTEPATPPGVAVRRAALRMLDGVLRRGLPLETVITGATAELDRADDRGLARAIASNVLRWLADLDALIDGATAKPLPDDAKARMLLRIALAQTLGLGTPPHAAIATVLPLADGGPRRLVHGVFGTLSRRGVSLPATPSLPAEVTKRWTAAWGPEAVEEARAALAAQPPIDLVLRDPADLREGETLAPGHRRLPAGTDVAALPGYAEGAFWVQDIAATIPARLFGAGDGRRMLDLCAAPGGKTMQLAAAGWDVTALDNSATRLERLRANLARTRLEAEVVTADVFRWAPPAPAAAVLLDAPCTATGVFRRHPEVLHRIGPRAVASLAATQARMLARAADWVQPGGTLVYATCSGEREEGEVQVAPFLAGRPDFALEPVTPDEVPAGPGIQLDGGTVRVRPGAWAASGGADAFFVARFRRTG